MARNAKHPVARADALFARADRAPTTGTGGLGLGSFDDDHRLPALAASSTSSCWRLLSVPVELMSDMGDEEEMFDVDGGLSDEDKSKLDQERDEEVVLGGRLSKQLLMHSAQIGVETLRCLVNTAGEHFVVTITDKHNPSRATPSEPDKTTKRLAKRLAQHLLTMNAAALEHIVTVHGKEYLVSAKYCRNPGLEEAA